MKLQRYYLAFLLLWVSQNLFAPQPHYHGSGHWYILFFVLILIDSGIVVAIALTIYLLGQYAFKMRGKFWITLLVSVTIHVVLLYLFSTQQILKTIVGVIGLYFSTILSGVLGYYLSHKRSIKRQNNAENGS